VCVVVVWLWCVVVFGCVWFFWGTRRGEWSCLGGDQKLRVTHHHTKKRRKDIFFGMLFPTNTNNHRIISRLTENSQGVAIHSSNGISIKAGELWQLPVIVKEISVMFFHFYTADGNDIEFDLFATFDEQPTKPLQVIAPVRCRKQQGELDVIPGVYQLRWSNIHSWVTSKTILYAIFLASKSSLEKEQQRVQREFTTLQKQQKLVWIRREIARLQSELDEAEQCVLEGKTQQEHLNKTLLHAQTLVNRLVLAVTQTTQTIDKTNTDLRELHSQSKQLVITLHDLEQNSKRGRLYEQQDNKHTSQPSTSLSTLFASSSSSQPPPTS